MNHAAIARAAQEYKPLLDDLRTMLDGYLDALLWLPRQDTAITPRSRFDPRPVVRVGPDFARGVLLVTVDPRRLTELVNTVLRRHDFPEQEFISGSRSGHLTFTCHDGAMAELSFWLKGDVEYWVYVPFRA